MDALSSNRVGAPRVDAAWSPAARSRSGASASLISCSTRLVAAAAARSVGPELAFGSSVARASLLVASRLAAASLAPESAASSAQGDRCGTDAGPELPSAGATPCIACSAAPTADASVRRRRDGATAEASVSLPSPRATRSAAPARAFVARSSPRAATSAGNRRLAETTTVSPAPLRRGGGGADETNVVFFVGTVASAVRVFSSFFFASAASAASSASPSARHENSDDRAFLFLFAFAFAFGSLGSLGSLVASLESPPESVFSDAKERKPGGRSFSLASLAARAAAATRAATASARFETVSSSSDQSLSVDADAIDLASSSDSVASSETVPSSSCSRARVVRASRADGKTLASPVPVATFPSPRITRAASTCEYFVCSGFPLSRRRSSMTLAWTSGTSTSGQGVSSKRPTSISSARCFSSCACMPRRSRRASTSSRTACGSGSGNEWCLVWYRQ